MPGGGAHPPYKVVAKGGKFIVYNGLGEQKASFGNKLAAEKYVRALFAAAARTSSGRAKN